MMFLRRACGVFVVVVVGWGMLCSAANPQGVKREKHSVPPVVSPLKISVDLSKSEYGKSDNMELQVNIRNESPVDIYIIKKGGISTAVSVGFRDHISGRNVNTSFVPNLMSPPPDSAEDFVKLRPGDKISETIDLSLADFELRRGHTYDLLVEYRSSVPKVMNFGLNIFSSEMGSVAAVPVVIRISK